MSDLREAVKFSLTSEVLASGGKVRLRALGSSMLPTLWPGDLLTIESSDIETVVPGDIVLVSRGSRYFVHRVVEKIDRNGVLHWVTRGDAVPQSDPAVETSDLLGRVSSIQRQHRVIAPSRRLSFAARFVAWILCHWNLLRKLSLLMYSRRTPDPQVLEVIV